MNPDWVRLANQARDLRGQINDPSGLPVVHRSLAQLASASQKLAANQTNQSINAAPTAQIFLAKSGVDLQQEQSFLHSLQKRQIQNQLQVINQPINQSVNQSLVSYQPAPLSYIDVDSYLGRSHTQMLQSTIQSINQANNQAFDRYTEVRTLNEWDANKRDILQSLGFQSAHANGRRYQANNQANSQSPHSLSESTLPIDQQIYGDVITRFNQAKNRHQQFSLVKEFKSASERLEATNHSTNQSINKSDTTPSNLFTLLTYLTEQNDQALRHMSNPLFRMDLIKQSIKYCSDLFRAHLQDVVSSQSNNQSISQSNSLVNQVQRYVNQQMSTFGRLNDRLIDYYPDSLPFWPQVFHLIRASAWSQAATLVKEYQSNRQGHNQSSNQYVNLISALESRAHEQTINQTVNQALTSEYSQLIMKSNSFDPYKVAVYQLTGRFSHQSINQSNNQDVYGQVCDSAESYVWYKLHVALGVEHNDQNDLSNTHSITQFARQLTESGESHFNPTGSTPLVYVQLLCMTGCFEKACQYLTSSTPHIAFATHFAMTCYAYGLLHNQSSNQSNDEGLSKLLTRYLEVSSLLYRAPRLAVQYAAFLNNQSANPSNNPSKQALDMCCTILSYPQNISSLVQTDAANNQSNTPAGLLYELFPHAQVSDIVRSTSQRLLLSGSAVECVSLLMKCCHWSDAADAVLASLSVTSSAAERTRSALLTAANTILQSSNQSHNQSSISRAQQTSLSCMLACARFWDSYHAGPAHYDEALSHLDTVNLLPQRAQHMQNTYPECVQRHLPELYCAVAEIYYHQYRALSAEKSKDNASERQTMLQEWKERMKTLLTYTALNCTEVNTKCMRIEAQMS